MSLPRTTGPVATIYRTAETTDADGNRVQVAVRANPHRVRVSVSGPSSGAVDTPGAAVPTYDLAANVPAGLAGVGIGTVVELDGAWYDLDVPPERHHSVMPALRHDTLRLSLRASGAPAGW